MRSRFLTLLKHPAVAKYIEAVRTINPGPNPYHDYFAFNYDDQGIASLKIYFSFYRILKKPEILKLLPDDERFMRLYSHWEPTKIRTYSHSGCSFAIKIKDSEEPTYQFHYRMPHGPYIQPPKKFAVVESDWELQPGVSSEYTGARVVDKNYFYLRNSPGILDWCKERGEVCAGQIFEYTETAAWSKIINWYTDGAKHQEAVARLPSQDMRNFLQSLSREQKVTAGFPGVYENGVTRSIYLFQTIGDGREIFPHTLDGQHRTVESALEPLL